MYSKSRRRQKVSGQLKNRSCRKDKKYRVIEIL